MKAIESGGSAPPIIVATLADRITEYLTGEADYNVRDLLREARQELVLIAGDRALAQAFRELLQDKPVPPYDEIDAAIYAVTQIIKRRAAEIDASKPEPAPHWANVPEHLWDATGTPAPAEAVEALPSEFRKEATRLRGLGYSTSVAEANGYDMAANILERVLAAHPLISLSMDDAPPCPTWLVGKDVSHGWAAGWSAGGTHYGSLAARPEAVTENEAPYECADCGTPSHSIQEDCLVCTQRPQQLAVTDVLREVHAERQRQEAKWGQQNHPDFDQILLNREGGCTSERMAREYEIPTANRAKFLCEEAFRRGEGTYGHILIEEVAEAFAEIHDKDKLRTELIQCAAVAVAWVEKIDRDTAALPDLARKETTP